MARPMPAPPPVTSAVLPSRLIINSPFPGTYIDSAARHFGVAPQAEDLAFRGHIGAPVRLYGVPAIFDVEARGRFDIGRDHQVVAMPAHIDRDRRAALLAAVDAASQIVELVDLDHQ